MMDRATALKKRASRHNPQYTGWPNGWPIRGFIPSFSPKTAIEAVGLKPPSVDGRQLGLPGSYLWHAIGTFNTCSQRPIYPSLIDTGEGYNLGGVAFPHHTPWHFQPMVLHSTPKGPGRSLVKTYRWLIVFRPHGVYWSLYLHLAMASVVQILARSSRVTRKVFIMQLWFQSTPIKLMYNHS
jgi:hypothetical protein